MPSAMAKAEKRDSEEKEKSRSSKKRKKSTKKKDKWGQPLQSTTTGGEEDAVECPGGGMDLESGGVQVEEETSGFEPKKVVVSGMPYSTTEDDIRDFFKDVGQISQIQMTRFPDSGNFRGLAFITFKNAENATKSLELDGMKMGGRFLKIERSRVDPAKKQKSAFLEDPQKVEGCYSAYIGNLAWDVTEGDIRNFLEKSKIDSIRLAVNKNTGQFRGFAHVDFADDESLEEAIMKNQVEFHGRPIKIAYAVGDKR